LILARLEEGSAGENRRPPGHERQPIEYRRASIGAISCSIGAFPTERSPGFAIAEMSASEISPPPQGRIELPITREGLTAALSATYARLAPFANRPADVQVIGMPSATGSQLGAMLRPISTPLVMNGFEPESAAMLTSAFGAAGFTPVVGGGMGQGSPELKKMTGPLRKGTRSVFRLSVAIWKWAPPERSHIDGDRVYAFGHPFFNVSPSQFPLTRAFYAMMPSLMSSFKISSMGEVIGTMQRDRETAIAGTLGKGPVLHSHGGLAAISARRRQADNALTFQHCQRSGIHPLLTYVALANTLGSSASASSAPPRSPSRVARRSRDTTT
jgi:hypothetical protein